MSAACEEKLAASASDGVIKLGRHTGRTLFNLTHKKLSYC